MVFVAFFKDSTTLNRSDGLYELHSVKMEGQVSSEDFKVFLYQDINNICFHECVENI